MLRHCLPNRLNPLWCVHPGVFNVPKEAPHGAVEWNLLSSFCLRVGFTSLPLTAVSLYILLTQFVFLVVSSWQHLLHLQGRWRCREHASLRCRFRCDLNKMVLHPSSPLINGEKWSTFHAIALYAFSGLPKFRLIFSSVSASVIILSGMTLFLSLRVTLLPWPALEPCYGFRNY